ncbi:MAG: SGNH/GDSL hydrolase family protein [Dactylosporangium sp.]|nr:SGNH/GDSL hydrolase family protein [Dactylosporangium sp.]NNJ61463.1 SGNH/GDSL hydrolase family protein [Dactylosporangium sp.]
MPRQVRRYAIGIGLVAALVGVTTTVPAQATQSIGRIGGSWTAAWGASPVEGADVPWMPSCQAGAGLADQTVRNVLFLSAGGNAVRVRLSNVFGQQSMAVGHATVAVQASEADPVPGSMRELTFAGSSTVTIAAGAQALSDPVDLTVAPLSTLLISVYVAGPTGPVTNHPFTAQGNYIASGDLTTSSTTAEFSADNPCWMLVDGVDVRVRGPVLGSIVALGDSITDTSATTGNTNHRWPDYLARRLNERRGPVLSVVNAGLGGNRVLEPRTGEPYWGIPALARLHRDVFSQTGVRDVILFEGVNDIGFDATAEQLIAGYQQIIAQTHAQGLRVFGATVTQFKGSFVWTDERAATWRALNDWIRTSGAFDAVFDFAAAVADPADPAALAPAYDSGDHLHPNDAGCEAMADAIDLKVLLAR